MDIIKLRTAASMIWARIYQSTLERLNLTQLREIKNAISDLRQWDKADRMAGKATDVADRAHLFYCDLTAIPERKPYGCEGLMNDCDALASYLDAI